MKWRNCIPVIVNCNNGSGQDNAIQGLTNLTLMHYLRQTLFKPNDHTRQALQTYSVRVFLTALTAAVMTKEVGRHLEAKGLAVVQQQGPLQWLRVHHEDVAGREEIQTGRPLGRGREGKGERTAIHLKAPLNMI